MTLSRTRQWALVLSLSAVAAACVTNQLTETCIDDLTCPESPGTVDPSGGADTSTDAGARVGCRRDDLDVDPNNCGTCGHSCFGGACAGGACLPVKLSDFPGATGLALANGGVVVTADIYSGRDGVYYVPPNADGGIVRLSTERAFGPSTDGVHACWVTGSHVSCSLLDGGASLAANDEMFPPEGTLFHDGYVYWLTNFKNTWLRRANVSRDASTTTPVTLDVYSHSYDLVRDGDRLLWFTRGFAENRLSLYAAPIDGGVVENPREVAAVSTRGIRDLAVAQNVAYFSSEDYRTPDASDIGGIYRVPTDADGGSAIPILRQSLGNARLAVDRTHIYYTYEPNGTVYRVPIPTSIPDGGSVPAMDAGSEAIAFDQGPLQGIRVDDRFVYWVSGGPDGALMRLTK